VLTEHLPVVCAGTLGELASRLRLSSLSKKAATLLARANSLSILCQNTDQKC
jgi:hypothetical protein